MASTKHLSHHRPDLRSADDPPCRRRRLRWVLLLVALVAGLAPVAMASPVSAASGTLSMRFESTSGKLVSGTCYEVWTVVGGEYGTRVSNTCNTSGLNNLSVDAGDYAIVETQAPTIDIETNTAHMYRKADEARVSVAGGSTAGATLTHAIGATLDASALLPDGTTATGVCFEARIRVNGQIADSACSYASGVARMLVPANTLLNVYQTSGPEGYGMAPGKPVDALSADTRTSITGTMTAGARIDVRQTDTGGATITGGCYQLSWTNGVGEQQVVATRCDDDDAAGADGTVVFAGVSSGNYRLSETEAPAGYLATTDDSSFSVGAGSSITVSRSHQALPHLHVITVSASGERIPGSCFVLRFPDDVESIPFQGCDGDDGADDGELNVTDLQPADYVLYHSHTDGYPRYDTPEPFTLDTTDVTITITLGTLEAPVNTALPTIEGNLAVGSPLHGTTGTWTGSAPIRYLGHWQQCNATGAACVDIADSTGETFTPSAQHVGATFRYVVWASNDAGDVSATSAPTAVLGAAAPTNVTAPTVSGTVVLNGRLSLSVGTWTGAPTSFTYQWLRCDGAGENCAPIGTATGTSYTLTSADAGSRIRVEVTASNGSGSGVARSAATATMQLRIPESIQPPTITRVPFVGAFVATEGWWRSTAGTATLAFQWLLCDAAGEGCAPINGATSALLVPGNQNVNKSIRVRVTATNVEGSAQATSAAMRLGPVNTSAPTISGNPRIGQRLTATTGGWSSTSGYTQTSYTWLKCDGAGNNCYAVYGYAIANNYYVVKAEDVGSTFRVIVFRRNADGGNDSMRSDATAPVVKVLPVNTAVPVISGSARLGQRLTASRGSWSSDTPITDYGYGWLRCDAQGNNCHSIHGYFIASNTYTVRAADVGSTIRVEVFARNTDGTTESPDSAATAVVNLYPPVNTAAPTLSGTARVGQRLTASRGSWSSDTPITEYAYAWMRCDAQGNNCHSIHGYYIASNTYTVRAEDAGSRIRVQVFARNTDGTTESPDSAATAVVNLYPPVNT
ncbi:MAG: hypothetical protein HZB15_04215, partial [Actinobacteria bacterium]|nr:hypothetical protein [Actinomycetota bacterium]